MSQGSSKAAGLDTYVGWVWVERRLRSLGGSRVQGDLFSAWGLPSGCDRGVQRRADMSLLRRITVHGVRGGGMAAVGREQSGSSHGARKEGPDQELVVWPVASVVVGLATGRENYLRRGRVEPRTEVLVPRDRSRERPPVQERPVAES